MLFTGRGVNGKVVHIFTCECIILGSSTARICRYLLLKNLLEFSLIHATHNYKKEIVADPKMCANCYCANNNYEHAQHVLISYKTHIIITTNYFTDPKNAQ